MLWGLFPRVSVSCYCVSLDKGFWSPHYMFKCPYFNSSVHFLFFFVVVAPEKSYSFKYRCLGDHFEECFLIFALFVIFFCSSVYKGCVAMVMISSVHEEKGSRVENRRHRSSLHKTLFSPDPPFCSGMAHLYSHVWRGLFLNKVVGLFTRRQIPALLKSEYYRKKTHSQLAEENIRLYRKIVVICLSVKWLT